MSRKKRAKKRTVAINNRFESPVVQILINKIMERGKKNKAMSIVYKALSQAGDKLKVEPLMSLEKAIENVRPLLEVKPRRVGGATYQVPVEVNQRRGMNLGIQWLITYARNKKGLPMETRLANEIVAAVRNEGDAVKKKEDTHRMAEANRAFAHYRW